MSINKAAFIYAMQIGTDGAIKIGSTRAHPKQRASALQGQSPYDLRLLGVYLADTDEERRLHKLFADSRIRGEWYRPTKQMLDFIENNIDSEGADKLIESALKIKEREEIRGTVPSWSHPWRHIFLSCLDRFGLSEWEFRDWFLFEKIPPQNLVPKAISAINLYKEKTAKLPPIPEEMLAYMGKRGRPRKHQSPDDEFDEFETDTRKASRLADKAFAVAMGGL